ncbi:alkaline phosphatase synthesis sensor protein PhoR [Clostridium acetireducens DSM 10703]|uniref:histidine kinase n=1 Tax=Clostridium acetireducens DSM 10703 TaxID=1121290 RepID=A0A1E8EXB7_9CLOT|nr:ATP-binding protein [Clostridium acetireducens]OFI05444.1 alkaline phosphatase synthesis sensor protein PhoR [Clostridium acetireducens DSM 10703]
MKKKLMISILITVFFSFIISAILFIVVANYEYIEGVKENLRNNNKITISIIENNNLIDKDKLFKNIYTNNKIRLTYVDNKGVVIKDSLGKTEEFSNHNNREEIIKARKYGEGYTIRYSDSTKKEIIYFATYFKNGYVIRSSIPIDTITGLKSTYYKYYLFIFILVLLISFIISSKLSNAIISPIKELEFTTYKIALGDMNRRVNIKSKDEIGELANTFNSMADRLQNTLRDALEKQNRIEAILRSMDSGVIAVDKDLKILMINPYAKKLFGINKDIIGKNLLENIEIFKSENIFKEDEEGIYKEITLLWNNKKYLRVRIADIINGYEYIGKVAVLQDITDIKKLENMRSQFVANVSHELKTPLTSIKGFAETLKYVDDAANKEKFLNIINDEAERLTRLINDILTLSHIENNKYEKSEYVNLNEVIKDVCNLIKNVAKNKNIEVSVVGDKIPNMLCERDKIKQMVLNLVDNAVKYTNSNGKVVVGTKLEDKKCVLWVEDTGEGISKEHIERLFERFYRVDKARSRSQGGTGLGLAIVKHIVMGLDGDITVESEVGKGSKFIVTIPIDD